MTECEKELGLKIWARTLLNLFAVNTAFQNKRSSSNATYVLSSTPTNAKDEYDDGDNAQLLGKKFVTKYHGKISMTPNIHPRQTTHSP